jgi:D-alanyl-D-alanine carboxypeptidase (penicillin-binding protein 5/6)
VFFCGKITETKLKAKENMTMKKIVICMVMMCSLMFNASIGLATVDMSKILIEPNTGKVLFSENENEQRPIASVTKIMTLLLTFEHLEAGDLTLEQKLTISEYASSMGGSQALLYPGEEITVDGLLESVVIASANDSCVALGEGVAGGSIDVFIQMMNDRALELGMTGTHFENCTGLPEENAAYSTAKDVSIMARELIKHEKFFQWSTIWHKYMEESRNKTDLNNTNRLTQTYDGCDGVKTGSTDEAGFCLAATAKKGDMRLISVLLGAASAQERFDLSAELLDYGFANYKVQTIISKDDLIMQDIPIEKGVEDFINVLASKDIEFIENVSEQPEYKRDVVLYRPLVAPIQDGQEVGKVTVKDEAGIIIAEMPLVCDRSIEKATFGFNLKKLFSQWF